jgi:ribosomal protein S18 acetylase RimI-like enzyme
MEPQSPAWWDDFRAELSACGLSSLVIEDLVEDDLDRLAWSGTALHLEAVGAAWERTASGGVEYLVARSSDWPVAKAGIDYDVNAAVGVLWQLATAEALRGMGIGAALVGAAEARIVERGRSWARLSVETNNDRARRLYVRLGYVEVGRATESWLEVGVGGTSVMYHADVFVMAKPLADLVR